jgi:hypothetical protein
MCEAGAWLQAIEALRCALAGQELAVALVDVGRDEPGAFRIGARHDNGRHAADVGREPRRIQIALVRGARDEHLAAEMAAFLLGCQLILEMHSGSPGLDVRLHDLVGVERPSETRLGICNDWGKPVVLSISLGMLDLIGAGEGAVDTPAQLGPGARGVETLIRKHCTCRVVVRGDLPAGEVDALQTSSDHLHRLISCRCAQRGDERPTVEKVPESIRAGLSQGVPDGKRAAQPEHILRRVGPVDS